MYKHGCVNHYRVAVGKPAENPLNHYEQDVRTLAAATNIVSSFADMSGDEVTS